MDYSLTQAVKNTAHGVRSLIVLYDIWCQYGVHLKARIAPNPYLTWPENARTVGGIGLFHIHGHQRSCMARFSPTFIVGAGQIEGEIIETLWRKLNEVSPSARSMTAAHREELLDDHMNDSNFKKMLSIGMF